MGLAEVYTRWSYPVGGVDKGTVHDYLPTYEEYLTRTHGVTVLEVGVWMGHSIGMWQEFFTDSTVHGLDVDLTRVRFDLPHLHQCDATDAGQVEALFAGTAFDYVIDDGSHALVDQLAAFDIFWPRITHGGAMFIEDIPGDAALDAIVEHVREQGVTPHVYDGRNPQRQWDEIMIVAVKP